MTRAVHSSARDSISVPLAPEPRARRPRARGRLQAHWEIPIIDAERRIVGWTSTAPEYRGTLLHHAEAERLVGGPVLCAYVQIDAPRDAGRAGAPRGWKGAWRCLGLCSERGPWPKPGHGLPTVELSE